MAMKAEKQVVLTQAQFAQIMGSIAELRNGNGTAALATSKPAAKSNGNGHAKPTKTFGIKREDKVRPNGKGLFLSFSTEGADRFMYAAELAELIQPENIAKIKTFLAGLK
jgi:hypothetical protein